MKGDWSLDSMYKGYDDPKFAAELKRLEELKGELEDAVKEMPNRSEKENLRVLIPLLEEKFILVSMLSAYCEFRRSVNTSDGDAASHGGRIALLAGSLAGAEAAAMKYIGGVEDTAEYPHYAYFFRAAKEEKQHLLSEEAEETAAKYDISGGKAWSELQGYMTSTVTEEVRGEQLNLATIRNLAYDPDKDIRKEAYDAEMACYGKIKDTVAYSINSIKLQSISECALRGFESPLDKSLYHSRMKKSTLDALLGAVREYLPMFHEYLAAKGRALGYENGLPWWEMFAPMGKEGKRYTAEEARALLVDILGRFDPEMGKTIDRAFEEKWIDLYPHAGKVGGAYCEAVQANGEFRVMTNFGGLLGDVSTIAHELGHGYHEMQVNGNPPLNRLYSMPVAETASTFNENLLMNYAVENAADDEELLALVEGRLSDTTQIICDIYSRFLFEKAVCDRRSESFMFADELCALMKDAQKQAYGKGLDEDTLNQYMWVCKPHYYSADLSFYNYPYSFGGLFARGLYEMYLEQGEAFLPKYKEMLKNTPMTTVEEAARICGADVEDINFWKRSLEAYRSDVELFKKLTDRR